MILIIMYKQAISRYKILKSQQPIINAIKYLKTTKMYNKGEKVIFWILISVIVNMIILSSLLYVICKTLLMLVKWLFGFVHCSKEVAMRKVFTIYKCIIGDINYLRMQAMGVATFLSDLMRELVHEPMGSVEAYEIELLD